MAEYTGCRGARLDVFVANGSPVRVVAVGEVDASSAGRLETTLANLSGRVELDCSGLSFVDASFLRTVATAHQSLSAQGGSLLVIRPSDPVRYLLDLFGPELGGGPQPCSCKNINGDCCAEDARIRGPRWQRSTRD